MISKLSRLGTFQRFGVVVLVWGDVSCFLHSLTSPRLGEETPGAPAPGVRLDSVLAALKVLPFCAFIPVCVRKAKFSASEGILRQDYVVTLKQKIRVFYSRSDLV